MILLVASINCRPHGAVVSLQREALFPKERQEGLEIWLSLAYSWGGDAKTPFVSQPSQHGL